MSRTSPKLCIALAWIFTAGGGCYAAASEPNEGDTHTNWLKCERDADCDEGAVCVAKMCVVRSTSAPLDAGDQASPVSIATPPDTVEADDVLSQPMVVETGPESAVDLDRCANAVPYELLTNMPYCDAEPCPRVIGLSSPQDERLLVLAFGRDDPNVAGGIPNFAVLDADGLSAFETIPGIAATDQLIGAGPYVAVSEETNEILEPTRLKAGLLYQWQDGVLADMGPLDGIADIAARGSRVLVAGAEGTFRQPWLALFEGSTQTWRIPAPAEAMGADAFSLDIAQDTDGSSAWLVQRDHNSQWHHVLVRIDAMGNPVWTKQLGPIGAVAGESPEDLVHPHVTTAGGVTSIAGVIDVAGDGSNPLVELSLRQYDDEGVELRRWTGLANSEHDAEHSAPVADLEGNVYVAWDAPSLRRQFPERGFVILRFAPSGGDPCVLANGDGSPHELLLRDSDLVFLIPGGIARLPS